MRSTVLGARALNRALLARQLLLRRSKRSVSEAIEQRLRRQDRAALADEGRRLLLFADPDARTREVRIASLA